LQPTRPTTLPSHCGDRLAPTVCDASGSVAETLKIWPTADANNSKYTYRQQSVGKNFMVMGEQSYDLRGDSIIPSDYRSCGWFWWTTQLEKYLWRPSSSLETQLEQARSNVGLTAARAAGELVLGMHVRQGDACADAARSGRACSPLSEYMASVEELHARTGVSIIYLATDSDSVLEQTKDYPAYTFLTYAEGLRLQKSLAEAYPNAKSWDETLAQNIAHGRQDLNQQVALFATIELMMLTESDFFVGKFTSNLFRTAYELSAARCNCAKPFVSLDSPWCFDYGVEVGKGVSGTKFAC